MAEPSRARPLRSPGVDSSGLRTAKSAEFAVVKFLRSFHVLLRSARFYHRNHPKELESLQSAERDLRAALRQVSPIGVALEGDTIRYGGRPLHDPRGELKSLAGEMARYGVHTLVFDTTTNVGELGVLAHLLDGSPASRTTLQRALGVSRDWGRLLADLGISGIRINILLSEKRGDAALASLVALFVGPELPSWIPAAPPADEFPRTIEEFRMLANLEIRLTKNLKSTGELAPQDVARTVRSMFSVSDPRAVGKLAAMTAQLAPAAEESLESYCFRFLEECALNFVRAEVVAGRCLYPNLREVLNGIARDLSAAEAPLHLVPLPGPPEDAFAEHLYQTYWAEMDPTELSGLLRGAEAWCAPVEAVRNHLERLAEADRQQQARSLLLRYAEGLQSPNNAARLAAAGGLCEIFPLVERLWASQWPLELARTILRALAEKQSPEVAALLTALVDRLAQLALARKYFAELEKILAELEQAPRNSEGEHLHALAKRILREDRWLPLVEAGLDSSSPDPGLAEILARQPDRLLDHLGARLAGPESKGVHALPAMARLLRATGEPVIGALVARAFEPRAQRATAAVKLLAAAEPKRLVEILPRALPSWDWNLQDMAIGELIRSRPAGYMQAFVAALEQAHPLVVPMLIDQAGMTREANALPKLMEIAAGENERLKDIFIRIKAVEALGRMQAKDASSLLRSILRDRAGLTHVEPAGLRAAAEEALGIIENRPSSARVRADQAALEKTSAEHTRPRRYLRIALDSPLDARIEGVTPAEVRVRTISLGGAFLEAPRRLNVGESLALQIRSGLRKIEGTAVVRNVAPGGGGVEFVYMRPDDRERLRKLVSRLAKT